jgi:hypothetical protein
VRLGDRGDPVHVRWAVGRRGQRPGRGGLAHLHHQILEAAGDADEEHSAAGVADRDVAWPEGVVARARLDDGVADLESDLALEDPEGLVLAVMDVKGRLGAGGSVTSTIVSCPPCRRPSP